MAMILDGDVTEYYAWFIQKRYNLILNKTTKGCIYSSLMTQCGLIMVKKPKKLYHYGNLLGGMGW
jgi:hypothetical protein